MHVKEPQITATKFIFLDLTTLDTKHKFLEERDKKNSIAKIPPLLEEDM